MSSAPMTSGRGSAQIYATIASDVSWVCELLRLV